MRTAPSRRSPRHPIRPGEIIEIAVTIEHLHFLDPATRLTIPEGS